jgi:hypothetical protein
MSTIHDLKKYLKEQTALIRATKTELKHFQRENGGYDGGFFKKIRHLSINYRHHHIAYSLLKGKTYDQIEKPAIDNKPDMSFIEEIKDAYTENVCASAE